MTTEIGFGISTKTDSVEAGRSATQGAINKIGKSEPTMGFLWVSPSYNCPEVVRGMRKILGEVPVYGFFASKGIYNQLYDRGVGLMLMASDDLVFDPLLITDFDTDFDNAMSTIMDTIKTLSFKEKISVPSFLFGVSVLSGDPLTQPLWEIQRRCLSESLTPPPMMVVELEPGSSKKPTGIIINGSIYTDAFLGLTIHSKLGFDVSSGASYQPIGKSLTITGVNDAMVTSLNGVPAWKKYCEALGLNQLPYSKWKEVFRQSPLALVSMYGAEIVQPRQVDKKGAFNFGFPMRKGTCLQIMKPEDKKTLPSLVKQSKDQEKVKEPILGLAFKTPEPSGKVGTRDIEIDTLTKTFPDIPIAGFYVNTILSPDPMGRLLVRNGGAGIVLLDKFVDPAVEYINQMHRLVSDSHNTNRQLQNSVSELTNLYRITQSLTETTNLERVLRMVLEGITNELGYDRASLCLVSNRQLVGQITIGHESFLNALTTSLSNKGNFMAACLDKRTPLIMETPFPEGSMTADLQKEFKNSPVASIPILAEGKKLGVVIVDNPFSKKPITFDGIKSLVTLANTAASAIYTSLIHQKIKDLNVRLQKKVDRSSVALQKAYDNLQDVNRELDEKIAKLSALNEISQSFIPVQDLDHLLQTILKGAIKELRGDRGSIMMFQPETNQLVIKVGIGLTPNAIQTCRLKIGEGIAGTVAKKRKPILVRDASTDSRFVFISNRRHANSLISVPLIVHGEVQGVINIENNSTSRTFTNKDLEFLEILASQGAITIANSQLFEKLEKNYFDTVSALSTAVEAKDPYTLGHSKRVTEYSLALADELSLSEKETQLLKFGAILHDVGKIGISGLILNKPGYLTDTEFESIKAHSIIGENIIKDIDFLQDVRPLIRHHQERYDGSGYPDGLEKDQIPFLASVIAVSDVYDALVTDRPYRPAYSHEEALKIIEMGAGRQFHPKAAETFLKIFR